jgi:hypothetical protein
LRGVFSGSHFDWSPSCFNDRKGQHQNKGESMFKEPGGQSGKLGVLLIALLAFCSVGCAAGVTKVKINMEPLEQIENKKEGNIFVKQFVDKRNETHYIGNKRNGFGMVLGHIGAADGINLEVLLTKYFAEALIEAGYNAVVQEPLSSGIPGNVRFDAIVEGEIVTFWMDLYMHVWHQVEVKVKALAPSTQDILWEKNVKGGESRVLWIGATAEYERIIREALTKALNQAAEEFASEEFYKAVKK